MVRRSFFAWLGDVFCGLAAYTLSRWLWKEHDEGVFQNLPQELATFAGCFVLLKLLLKAMGIARRNRLEAKAARKVLEKAAGRTP
ncbi:MAG: hypothetical protein JNM10_20075 [Planctomycetia bacterium]|nr:hypothetical protein [Planctomycetia bacterium]